MDTGDPIPDFELSNQEGKPVTRQDLQGRSVIMFFYPKAMTPGCTAEACDFRDNYRALEEAGYMVMGVSPDPPERNARFRHKEHLNFDLLSDPDHVLAEALGAWGTKRNYGKEYEGLIRSTFLIDAQGKLARAWRNVRAQGHVARVTADLGV